MRELTPITEPVHPPDVDEERAPVARAPLALRALAVVLLLYSSTAFVFLFRPQAADRLEGDGVVQLIWVPIYAAVALVWVRNQRRDPRAHRVDRWLLAFMVLAGASVLWSQAPTVTARRTVALGATVLCGLFLASTFTVPEVLRLFRTTVMIAAIGSIVILVFLPEQARDPLITDQNALRGAFIAKNLFGRMMVLGICAELLLLLYAPGDVLRQAVSIAVFGSLLLLSGSATSLVVLLAVAGVIVFIRWARTLSEPQLAVGVLLIAGAVAVAFLAFFSGKDVLLALLGRDATLTNRTRIWRAVMEGVKQRPVLGYGYGAFWRGNSGPSGIVYRTFNAPIGHAHNGFLEIWTQVGLVGLAVVAVLLVRSFAGAFRRVGSGDGLVGATAFGFLTFLLLFNLDESALLIQNSIYTILFCYVLAVMARDDRPALVGRRDDGRRRNDA